MAESNGNMNNDEKAKSYIGGKNKIIRLKYETRQLFETDRS